MRTIPCRMYHNLYLVTALVRSGPPACAIHDDRRVHLDAPFDKRSLVGNEQLNEAMRICPLQLSDGTLQGDGLLSIELGV
jgi:hypothetical protein